MLTRLREEPSIMLRMLPVLLGVDNETEGARPVTSADVGDLPVELYRVIAKEPPCTGAVEDLRGGGRPPPGLREMI